MGILVRNNKVISAGGKILYSRTGDPFGLPNLKLYLSATRMVQQADESLVSNFTDFSGFGYHATQANTANQPKFNTNQFGVNAGVKFDGTNDAMNITGGALDIFRNINQYTVQIATKRNTIGDTNYDLIITTNNNTTLRFAFYFFGGNANILIRKADVDATLLLTAPCNDTLSHFIQVTLNSSNYTVYMYIDGLLVGSTQLTSSGNLDNTPCAQINIGYSNITNVYGKSNINGISINTAYSDYQTIQAQYKGYLSRGYL